MGKVTVVLPQDLEDKLRSRIRKKGDISDITIQALNEHFNREIVDCEYEGRCSNRKTANCQSCERNLMSEEPKDNFVEKKDEENETE